MAMVDCTTAFLTDIPTHLLSNMTTKLVLKSNLFTAVPTTQLAAAPNLMDLDLTYNNITIITNASFTTTPNLEALDLDANSFLQEIQVGSFLHLRRLRRLNMRFMTSLTSLHHSHFSPLTALRILRLGPDKMQKPASDIFAALVGAEDIAIVGSGELSKALATESMGLSTLANLTALYVLCDASLPPPPPTHTHPYTLARYPHVVVVVALIPPSHNPSPLLARVGTSRLTT